MFEANFFPFYNRKLPLILINETRLQVWPRGHKTLPSRLLKQQQQQQASDEEEREEDNHGGGGGVTNRRIESTTMQVGDDARSCQVMLKNSYECTYCGRAWDSYPAFKTHMTEHRDEKCYRCIVATCGQLFKVRLKSFGRLIFELERFPSIL